METKQEMLSALQEEFERWEQLLGGLREDEIAARDMPSGLSIKDVVAHLMAWQRLSITRLRAARDNADPTYELGPAGLDPDAEENLERINSWIHETYADEPWPAVYKLWKDGFQAFLDLGRAIPDDVLLQPARFAWLG
ncbi:MAG TPA: ClbS/DfsB family four-helix bundle protein, partial [Anaerolineales bacterium]